LDRFVQKLIVQVVRFQPDGGVLLRYPPFEASSRREFEREYEAGVDEAALGRSDCAASTSAPVEEVFAGSRMRLKEAPVAVEKFGASPVTYATPLESMAAPWRSGRPRAIPLADESRASAAPTITDLES